MSEKKHIAATKWNWRPDGPVENNPFFLWPINVRDGIKWYFNNWKPLSEYFLFGLLAYISWVFLQPPLNQLVDFDINNIRQSDLIWLFKVYSRNIFYTLLVAGGLHLYFYTFAKQSLERKYEAKMLSADSTRFTFGKQVYDNMFWTLLSGVTIWTFYEVVLLYAQAIGISIFSYPITLKYSDSPILFLALFPLLPLWLSLHFYFGHRLLHWPPLYKISHIVHHRNINVGPWSGLSMHPIEHVIYLSSLLIHLLIPSHPIHIFFHAYGLTLSAIFGHVGFDSLMIKGKSIMAIGHFHHQLHHRHFECNYGASELPCDVWFNSFDDGSPEARQRLREQTKQRMALNKLKD